MQKITDASATLQRAGILKEPEERTVATKELLQSFVAVKAKIPTEVVGIEKATASFAWECEVLQGKVHATA